MSKASTSQSQPLRLSERCPRCHNFSLVALPTYVPETTLPDLHSASLALLDSELPTSTEWKVMCGQSGCEFLTIYVGDLTIRELQHAIDMQAAKSVE